MIESKAAGSTGLRVLYAAAELYPLLKTGGLADVSAALPVALRGEGVEVRLIVPGFPAILDGLAGLESVALIGPAFGASRLALQRGRLPGSDLIVYALDAPWLFSRAGNPYLAADGSEWPDNHRRFAAFGWVAAHLAFGELDPDWRADLLHAHDWHAGLAPAYLRAHPTPRVRSVFTVHNLAYQGRFGLERFRELGLGEAMLTAQGCEFHGDGSFLKAGLVYADRLTTVSPRYAEEIRTAEFGGGLDGVLMARRGDLSGILNGIDHDIWNPATDSMLSSTYSAERPSGKAKCKRAVQEALGLALVATAPMFTVVSRLTDQKGVDMVLGALPALLRQGAQLTVLGTGEAWIEQALRNAAEANPASVAVNLKYDEALAHRLIAGADAILVPSRYEPCGLTQLYGLRYGTVPVVRRVGGLADTVIDAEPPALEARTATGFVFDAARVPALEDALARALHLYRDAPAWSRLMRTGMGVDHSWARSAKAYVGLYRELCRAGSSE